MERLTNANHKEIGFCAYNGTQNPFEVPLTIGELAEYPNADFSPRKILVEVFDRLAAYEDTGLEPEEVLTAKENAKVACALNLLKEYQSVGSVEHFREFSQAERDGRLVVLPEAPERDRKSFINGLQDYFQDASFCDPSTGILGMSEGEKGLAVALMNALTRKKRKRRIYELESI